MSLIREIKLEAKKIYSSNLTRLRDNIYIGKPPKSKKVKPYANDLKFMEIIDDAILKYVGSDLSIDTYGLGIEYKLSNKKAEYLYSRLRQLGCIRKATPSIVLVEKVVEIEKIIDSNLEIHIELEQRLNDIRSKHAVEIRKVGEQVSFKEGFIYLIENSTWPGMIKAGMTIDYEARLVSYNVSDPFDKFNYVLIKWVADRKNAEIFLLETLSKNSSYSKGEWFRIDKTVAMSLF